MRYEKSCGAVVFTKSEEGIRFLLVRSLDGVYGFPKGHTEGSETEIETALREVFEETHLKIKIVDGFKATDEYPLAHKKKTFKKVTYFLGTFENQEVIYQKEELSGAVFVSYEEAMKLLKFESSRRILNEAFECLMSPGNIDSLNDGEKV